MAVTPMMKQYMDAKAQHPNALLLFRMGDFYELFQEDAETVARALGLALTSREKGENAIPMAGFPHHCLEQHLVKLVQAGYRVAICDQVEDPRHAKGLVQRQVTRIVTPGTITDEALLDPGSNNFLAAIALAPKDQVGLAWVDVSTGQFHCEALRPDQLRDSLSRVDPSECLVSEAASGEQLPAGMAESKFLTRRPSWNFHPKQARETLLRHFGVKTLEGFGVADDNPAVPAAGAIIEYLGETQRTSLGHVHRITPYHSEAALQIDEVTRRSLELVRTIREHSRSGSLVSVLDQTVTPMGARLLTRWVASPLADVALIEARQDAVEEFVHARSLRTGLRKLLGKCYDLERLSGRVATRRASPRDLGFLRSTLQRLPEIRGLLESPQSMLISELARGLLLCGELCSSLGEALSDTPPLVARDGGIIRAGYHAELDELNTIHQSGKQWLAEFQAEEAARTQIPNLKVGFNRVFGYYIEITNAHKEKAPPEYTRKQTLKNAERYITPKLKEYEEKVLRAEESALDIELKLFDELREKAARQVESLLRTATILATLDALAALANVAVSRNYVRPSVVNVPILEIEESRHPVIESLHPEGMFVPNDIVMGDEAGRIMVVTGPNMAGKSTYIRQAALLVIMAQIGGFIPARRARIGVCDRLFARVGASDEIARGHSTFMVEMVETAAILHGATERSLVILDEIGRGTSTYDGVSLAWAVAEFLHDCSQSRVLFATHYHELAELARSLDAARNLNVAVKEWEDEIIFLHKIVDGAADKSYGIHVARIAGVPLSIIERAKTILAELEEAHLSADGSPRVQATSKRSSFIQRSLFWSQYDRLIDEIRDLDPAQMSSQEAHEFLRRLRERID